LKKLEKKWFVLSWAHNDVVRRMMLYEKGDRQRVKSALHNVVRNYLPGLLDGWSDPA
jgi:hypothetical protein